MTARRPGDIAIRCTGKFACVSDGATAWICLVECANSPWQVQFNINLAPFYLRHIVATHPATAKPPARYLPSLHPDSDLLQHALCLLVILGRTSNHQGILECMFNRDGHPPRIAANHDDRSSFVLESGPYKLTDLSGMIPYLVLNIHLSSVVVPASNPWRVVACDGRSVPVERCFRPDDFLVLLRVWIEGFLFVQTDRIAREGWDNLEVGKTLPFLFEIEVRVFVPAAEKQHRRSWHSRGYGAIVDEAANRGDTGSCSNGNQGSHGIRRAHGRIVASSETNADRLPRGQSFDILGAKALD